MKTTLLGLTLCLTLISLCSMAALAADHGRGPQFAITKPLQQIHHNGGSDAVVAPMKIYSNLGPSDDIYDATVGYFVSGINNPFNGQKQDIAIPFTPSANATVTRVKAALQYYNIGSNGAMLAIYDDASGLPGTALAKRLRGNFSDFGTGCCDLALWTLKSPLSVTKGTQYWVVGTTNGKTQDAINTWDWVFNDAPGAFAFQQDDGGWLYLSAAYGYPPSAVAVRGTMP